MEGNAVIRDVLLFILGMIAVFGIPYLMMCYVVGGRPRCHEPGCERLILPMDAYCPEHAP